jgi:hypothetical protein
MGGTATSFLFDPAGDVGGDVFDGDVSGFCAAEKHHGVTIDKRYIRQVKRDVLSVDIFGVFGRQRPLQLGNILRRKLSAKADLQTFGVLSNCRNLQHNFLTPEESIARRVPSYISAV